jgi:mono/diheme cytochrome c family protein
MLVKKFVLGFVTAVVALWLGGWIYLRLGLAGVRADEDAPHWEARLMALAVRASVRRNTPNMQNPMPPTIENLAAGRKLYVNGCAGCHGALGKPPASPETLYTPIPKLPQAGTQYSDAEVFWIVKHGIRRTGMSAYGPFYSDQQMWDIAAFIENIRNLPPGVLEGIQSKKP